MKKTLTTPRRPSGFNEYLPAEQIEFNRLLDIIRGTYEKYGYSPIDTPDLELSEVLLAKGGGETEQQIYRFERGKNDLSLRFDLTVPLARYAAEHESHAQANANPAVDLVTFEKDKIKGAVRTDFILSAEIIAITLGTVATAPFGQQVAVLAGIALIMTVGVYGLVAGIVKLDDLGVWLNNKTSSVARAMGSGILRAAPWLMKGLSVAGTAAMFLVGGGILVHGVPVVHHAVEAAGAAAATWPVGPLWAVLVPNLLNAVVGIVAGGLVLAAVTLVQRLRRKSTTA